jgi:hypothetical protein
MSTDNRTVTGPARRRGEMHRAGGDRRVGHVIKARYAVPRLRVGGRAWLRGREGGGGDSRHEAPPTVA